MDRGRWSITSEIDRSVILDGKNRILGKIYLINIEMSEKSVPLPYSEHDPDNTAPPPSGYGQPYPIQGQPYPNQNQPGAGQNLSQPYPVQQAFSNNSKMFSKISCADFLGPSFMKFENPTKCSQ